MKTIRTATFAAVTCTLLLAANPAAFAADNCAELLPSKCTGCHNMNRVCQKVGKKSEKRWLRTIKRMEKHGSQLSGSEENVILTCLANPGSGTLQLCK